MELVMYKAHERQKRKNTILTLMQPSLLPNYYPHNNNNNGDFDLIPFDFNPLSTHNLFFFIPSSSFHLHNPLSDYSNSQSDIDSDSLAYTMNYGCWYLNNSSSDGLRIVSIESDSSLDEQYAISRVSEDRSGRGSVTDLPIFWTGGEELDWEEVSGRVDDKKGPSSFEKCDEIGGEALNTSIRYRFFASITLLEAFK
ncbi:hypothetical protein LguiB_017686 [Lonicera macranthoides]